MPKQDIHAELSKLSISNGDILLVKIPTSFTSRVVKALSADLEKALTSNGLGGVLTLIVTDEIQLKKLTPTQLEEFGLRKS